MKTYPQIGSQTTVKKWNNTYNWEHGCDICKKPFDEDEEFVRVDVEYTYMRGDDEVFVFHKRCLPKQHLLQVIKNL